MAKKYTQYTDLIDQYNEEHGVDVFKEYKTATPERQQEIEDWFFNLVRSVNEIPQLQLSAEDIDKEIIRLSETSISDVFNPETKEFGFNTNGVSICKYFFKEMYDVKKDGHPSVNDRFHSDYQLKRTIKKMFTYSDNDMSFLSWLILNGSGFGVTFRPAAYKSLVELFCKGKENCKIFDSSSGYGARLMGTHLSDVRPKEYLGIDPNTWSTCNTLANLLETRYPTGCHSKVLNMGSEDFTPESFPQYQKYFDFAATSPPYFKCEQYANDSTQSCIKFPEYDAWIEGFYKQTIYNTCNVVKDDGVIAINIFEKIDNIKNYTIQFFNDKGWSLVDEYKYMLRTMPGNTHKKDENGNDILMNVKRESYEPIWVFRKGN